MRTALAMTTAVRLLGLGAAFAQEPPPFPLIQDLPSRYNLTGNEVIDVLGVELGQPRTEAQTALQVAYPDYTLRPDTSVIGVKDARANEVSFSYYAGDNIGGVSKDKVRDTMNVYYSTPINGERVTGISRIVSYPDTAEADLNGLLAALDAKYGKPSYVQPFGLPGVRLYYIWYEGARVTISEEQWAAESKSYFPDPSPVGCRDMAGFIGGFSFSPPRKDEFPGCTASLVVEIGFGRRNDLVRDVRMEMIDWRRVYDAGEATNRFIQEAFDKATSAGGGAAAPAL